MLKTNGKSAGSLLVAVMVGALVIGALPVTAQAGISAVLVDTTNWSPRSDTSRTPLFRNGGNVIVVVGTDAGMLLANSSIEIRDGFCGTVGFGKLIAVGSITNRTTQIVNNIPTAKLTLSIPLTATHPRGNFCGHITYPAGQPEPGHLYRAHLSARRGHRRFPPRPPPRSAPMSCWFMRAAGSGMRDSLICRSRFSW